MLPASAVGHSSTTASKPAPARPPTPSAALAPPPFALAVIAGGFASATVDVTIYPLDTLKTRLQAPAGFAGSGGFRRLFAGVLPTALGSIPGGAVFFGVYETAKRLLAPGLMLGAEPPSFNGASPGSSTHWTCDATAAVLAATASCVIRTPTAVVAQRMQIGQYTTLAGTRWLSNPTRDGGSQSFRQLTLPLSPVRCPQRRSAVSRAAARRARPQEG